MKRLIKKKILLPLADIFLVPFVYPSAWLLKRLRKKGIKNLPLCNKVLLNIGVFPIRNCYYEPQFDMREIKHPFSAERSLPGINLNIREQLKILEKLTFSHELANIPINKTKDLEFYLNNNSFNAGDAEYWYHLIRLKKPRRIFEVGSGNSTLMAIKAIEKNKNEDSDYQCKHICIEPYENPWLENINVRTVREKVENVDISFFSELEENDILFIDSSHIIRPEGDVLFEYLQLLPTLNKGVIVHVHDIFLPRNYPHQWLVNEVRFWNEQYLLEAFLTHNNNWKVIGSLNFLYHNYYEKLKQVSPFLTLDSEPGSFYLQKI